jgi:hypothetical protein
MGDKDVVNFLRTIDARLLEHAEPGETAVLYLLGRSAMIVCCGLDLMTKDVDIVHDTSRLQEKALETFGEGTVAANILGLYLDPCPPACHPFPRAIRHDVSISRGRGRSSGRSDPRPMT